MCQSDFNILSNRILIRINVCIAPLLHYLYTHIHTNLSILFLMHELYSIKTLLARFLLRFFFISMFSIFAHIILIACFAVYKRTGAQRNNNIYEYKPTIAFFFFFSCLKHPIQPRRGSLFSIKISIHKRISVRLRNDRKKRNEED